MGLLDAQEHPQDGPEVSLTPAMFIALLSCAPIFVCTGVELALSLLGQAPTWLHRAVFLSAVFSWIGLLPLIAATLWASQQAHLATGSKLIMWAVVVLALLLTWVFPARVVDKKYVVQVPNGRGRLAHGHSLSSPWLTATRPCPSHAAAQQGDEPVSGL